MAENDFVTVRIRWQVQREAIYLIPLSSQRAGRPNSSAGLATTYRPSGQGIDKMSRIFTPSYVILNRNGPERPIRAAVIIDIIIIT